MSVRNESSRSAPLRINHACMRLRRAAAVQEILIEVTQTRDPGATNARTIVQHVCVERPATACCAPCINIRKKKRNNWQSSQRFARQLTRASLAKHNKRGSVMYIIHTQQQSKTLHKSRKSDRFDSREQRSRCRARVEK